MKNYFSQMCLQKLFLHHNSCLVQFVFHFGQHLSPQPGLPGGVCCFVECNYVAVVEYDQKRKMGCHFGFHSMFLKMRLIVQSNLCCHVPLSDMAAFFMIPTSVAQAYNSILKHAAMQFLSVFFVVINPFICRCSEKRGRKFPYLVQNAHFSLCRMIDSKTDLLIIDPNRLIYQFGGFCQQIAFFISSTISPCCPRFYIDECK